jgi:hypothetical protein
MSVSLGAEAHSGLVPLVVSDPRGPAQPTRGRGEANDLPRSVELASRDVMDEVCQRMAKQGRRWE